MGYVSLPLSPGRRRRRPVTKLAIRRRHQMQRVLFIYNRHAGKNKTWASLSDIINAMTEQDCLVTTYPTQYRGWLSHPCTLLL